jgi:hypothetical protein
MNATDTLRRCAILAALLAVLPAGAACAEEPDNVADEAPLELTGDAPLDLSTPEPEPYNGRLKPPRAASPAGSGWGARLGVDDRKVSIPAAEWQPEPLIAAGDTSKSLKAGFKRTW